MKKIKIIKFDNGSEAFIAATISVNVSGGKQISSTEIELEEAEAKKLLDQPVFYKLKDNKAILKKRSEIPQKHKSAFDKIVI